MRRGECRHAQKSMGNGAIFVQPQELEHLSRQVSGPQNFWYVFGVVSNGVAPAPNLIKTRRLIPYLLNT